MNQTFKRCLDNELKTAALKKHANHKQTPREPEMPFKALVDKIDQMDLTRTITNNHKRLYETNQTTNNLTDDLKQTNIACNNINDLNQNDLEQFEGTICNVLNGINNTYDRKNFKERPKFALFCSYCSSHGHTKGRCFKRPRHNTTNENTDRTHYPILANIHNNYFEINIDKNEYYPISYEKYHKETKTNLIPKYKPKIKNWHSPTIEKDDLIIEKNQKGPYTIHHDDDYLRLINNIKIQQKQNYENAKISDIFYDEKTKVTEKLIKETQILDPVLHKVKMWKKNNNKPHSVTLDNKWK